MLTIESRGEPEAAIRTPPGHEAEDVPAWEQIEASVFSTLATSGVPAPPPASRSSRDRRAQLAASWMLPASVHSRARSCRRTASSMGSGNALPRRRAYF